MKKPKKEVRKLAYFFACVHFPVAFEPNRL